MDQLILAEKLESLRRCISRVDEKRPSRIAQLIGSPDIQDILVLNLTRAVQLCVDIGSHIISESDEATPKTMGDVFAALTKLNIITEKTSQQMQKAVGFRNVAIHNYTTINWEIVYAIADKSLDDFRVFAKEIDAFAYKNPVGE